MPSSGVRRFAQCPNCKALERHRLQYLVLTKVLETLPISSMDMLHVAPERFFKSFFSAKFGSYDTADKTRNDVDYNFGLEDIPFENERYDFIFASHVLEHIQEDWKALAEIKRILKPNGIAILPVPLVVEKTVEYPFPNPMETDHVRAPGYKDYFERYLKVFSRVEVMTSDSFPQKYQLFIYEDRSIYPTKECPLRDSMLGEKHIDSVPICYA